MKNSKAPKFVEIDVCIEKAVVHLICDLYGMWLKVLSIETDHETNNIMTTYSNSLYGVVACVNYCDNIYANCFSKCAFVGTRARHDSIPTNWLLINESSFSVEVEVFEAITVGQQVCRHYSLCFVWPYDTPAMTATHMW